MNEFTPTLAEKEWIQYEKDHLGRQLGEQLGEQKDIVFEDANDGITLFAPQNVARKTREWNKLEKIDYGRP